VTIIYKIVNDINGRVYVGKTSRSLESRIHSHLRRKSYLPRSLRKHGLNHFSWGIIDSAESESLANWKEEYWIRTLNSKYPNGDNLTDGGEGSPGYRHTAETKRKMSESLIRVMNDPKIKEKFPEEIMACLKKGI